MSWRSLVFAPGNRGDLLAKFARFRADNYVIDLEDGTAAHHKASARDALADTIATIRASPLAGRLLVRINGLVTPHADDDLAVALATPIDGIVLPKIESLADLDRIDAQIEAAGRASDCIVVGGVESILGVLNIREFAVAGRSLRAVYFGPEDLAAEAGMERTQEGDEVIYARQRVVLAAKAAGIGAIDQAVVNVHDDDLFERDCARGRRFGYDGKICLNPRQAALANRLFSPDAAALDRARRLLQAYRDGVAGGRGTILFEGAMVDQPMVTRAETVIALAERDAA